MSSSRSDNALFIYRLTITSATNDGGSAVSWAMDGHGSLLRAEWNIRNYMASGRLAQVLPQCRTPDADIYGVYPPRHQTTERVRAFVEFLSESMRASKDAEGR